MSDLRTMSTEQDLDEALEASHGRPQLIFKHSLICPTSFWALREFEAYLESASAEIDHWIIPIQKARQISNAVAARLGVKHESPQALLVIDGKSVWNDSHNGLMRAAFDQATERCPT